jgi:AMIN domain
MCPSPIRIVAASFLCATVGFTAPVMLHAQGAPSIQSVQVLRGSGQVEIEIEASGRIVPQANVIAHPDRLIVDFVNAVPGAQLRNQAVNRREVKSLRVGLFSANPPVTRVVFDLNGPQPYQIFPSGKTIIVKVGTPAAEAARVNPGTGPSLVNASFAAVSAPVSLPIPAKPRLAVSFRDRLLSINTDQASLSEVLFAVHQRTGAEIAIPAGAEQEKVVVHLGPAPAPEVLAHLLNGSKFNFLILSSGTDPRDLDQVILSPRGDGPLSSPTPQLQPMSAEEENSIQPGAPPPLPPQPVSVPAPENQDDGQAPPPPRPEANDAPN